MTLALETESEPAEPGGEPSPESPPQPDRPPEPTGPEPAEAPEVPAGDPEVESGASERGVE
jgi:hypothetical protein